MHPSVAVVMAALGLGACSGAKESPPARTQPSVHRPLIDDARHEQAMRHFIDGAIFDSKDDYARAILEYQDALAFEQHPAIYYAISKDYLALNKQLQAVQAAREAVRLDSMTISYRQHLAEVYTSSFQTDLAIKEYEAILRIDSASISPWFNMARLYQASKPLRALEIYEKLLEQDGETWDVLVQAAELYRSLGRYDKAAEKYQRMLEIDPDNKLLRRQLAETYGRAGKFEDAVKILESMLEVDENDADVVGTLADLYLDRNDYQKAIDLYNKLLQRGQKNPEIKLRVGIAYYGMIQRDTTLIPKARAIFGDVAKELRNDWRPPLYLGSIALLQRQDSLAATYFERVITLAEWNADAWSGLGNAYLDRGEHQKVIETMDRAKRAVPKDYRVYLLSGLSYSQLGQTENAITALQKALELNPKELNAIGTLALTYDGSQQFQKSDSLYERALLIDPNYHLVLNNFSYSLAERNLQLQRALDMAIRAVAAEPKNASYLDTLGWVYYKLKNFKEAERYIAEAVATGQASAAVMEHLGDIYFQLGNKTKALEYWNKALSMNVNNQALKNKVQRGTL